MASNYKKLYKINERLWFEECPVLLESAGLFMNINTNAVIALCKFRNITEKRLKAVYLSLSCFGVDGAILHEDLDYVYLDLSVPSNEMFGEKTPIAIPDKTTRKIDIVVTKVIFEDDTYWENNDALILQPILSANPISSLGKLKEVYKWKTGFAHLPLEQSEYWICGCNGFNQATNQKCLDCGAEKNLVFSQANQEYLENTVLEYQEFLEQEKIKANEKAELKRINDKKERLKIAAAVMALVIMIAGIAIINRDSPELKAAKHNADKMFINYSLAYSTTELAETYLRYDGIDSEEYQSEKDRAEEYFEQGEEYERKLEKSKLNLNEKERSKLDKYIKKSRAKYLNN
jgi:hypothetical protein